MTFKTLFTSAMITSALVLGASCSSKEKKEAPPVAAAPAPNSTVGDPVPAPVTTTTEVTDVNTPTANEDLNLGTSSSAYGH